MACRTTSSRWRESVSASAQRSSSCARAGVCSRASPPDRGGANARVTRRGPGTHTSERRGGTMRARLSKVLDGVPAARLSLRLLLVLLLVPILVLTGRRRAHAAGVTYGPPITLHFEYDGGMTLGEDFSCSLPAYLSHDG